MIFMLFEFQKGSQSKWWPILENLPMQHDEIIFWNDEKLKTLEDPHFISIIKHERCKLDREIKVI